MLVGVVMEQNKTLVINQISELMLNIPPLRFVYSGKEISSFCIYISLLGNSSSLKKILERK